MNIVEAFVHGSRVDLPIGTILKPIDYEERWGESFVYTELEKYRPKECLPHNQSVFMVKDDNTDDIYHAGGPREGFMFVVEPLSKIECHNLAWVDDIVNEIENDGNEKLIAKLAYYYWIGKQHPENPDTYEYVTSKAKIISSEPYDI